MNKCLWILIIVIIMTQQQRIMLIYLWFIPHNRRFVFLIRTKRFFSSTRLLSDTKCTAHLEKVKHHNKYTSYPCQQADHVTAAKRVTDAHALVSRSVTSPLVFSVVFGQGKAKQTFDQDLLSLIYHRFEQSDSVMHKESIRNVPNTPIMCRQCFSLSYSIMYICTYMYTNLKANIFTIISTNSHIIKNNM